MASLKGSVPGVQTLRENHGYHSEEETSTSCDTDLLESSPINGGFNVKPMQPSEPYSSTGPAIKRKRRRQDDGIIATSCAWVVQHQIGICELFMLS